MNSGRQDTYCGTTDQNHRLSFVHRLVFNHLHKLRPRRCKRQRIQGVSSETNGYCCGRRAESLQFGATVVVVSSGVVISGCCDRVLLMVLLLLLALGATTGPAVGPAVGSGNGAVVGARVVGVAVGAADASGTGAAATGPDVGDDDAIAPTDGDIVGATVVSVLPPTTEDAGASVGSAGGKTVGDAVGLAVGDAVGPAVGDAVGLAVGDVVGLAVGPAAGAVVIGAVVVGVALLGEIDAGASVVGAAVLAATAAPHGSRLSPVFKSITFTLNRHGNLFPVTQSWPEAGSRAIPLMTSWRSVQLLGSPACGLYVYIGEASMTSTTSPDSGSMARM